MELERRLTELLDGLPVRELADGHQSRVFETTTERGDGRRIVKVVDASLVDPYAHTTRVETVADLARTEPHVCRPLPLRGRLVTDIDLGDGRSGLVTCYEHAGDAPVHADRPDDARRMGETLATLHLSLRTLGRRDLPLVAPLRAVPDDGAGPDQLLHGDFRAGNLRERDGMLHVFDFDDCGYGPASFDVANALYMVLFDDMTGAAPSTYAPFDAAFLSGYATVHGDAPDVVELTHFIRLRVAALATWLEDLSTAPAGLRTAAPAWHDTLRSFVSRHQARFGRW